ncbi:BlaI/MecI/CopY family transcriptional regulator [Planctomycetota bacterium]
MGNQPKISEAEWQVMKVLWEKSPLAVNEIVEILSARTAWKRETIRTLVNRLEKKGAIQFEKQGRCHLYTPVLNETQSVQAEAQSFVARAGTKVLKPILAAFMEEEDLTPEEIAELRRILSNKRGEGK